MDEGSHHSKVNVKTVVGVPGIWPTRSDIVKSIAGQSNGFVFAGKILMNMENHRGFELDVYDHDPELAHAFALAGGRSLSQADLAAIERHSFTLYVVGNGGSPESARDVMQAVAGLLHAGGIAAKVESAGVAHSAKDWFVLTEDGRDVALYHAYVTLIGQGDGRTYYSCGMHNLGYPDAVVSATIEPGTAAHLLETFLLYILIERPSLAAGHTFSVDARSPHYRLSREDHTLYPETSLFHNPFGLWRLTPVPSP